MWQSPAIFCKPVSQISADKVRFVNQYVIMVRSSIQNDCVSLNRVGDALILTPCLQSLYIVYICIYQWLHTLNVIEEVKWSSFPRATNRTTYVFYYVTFISQ